MSRSVKPTAWPEARRNRAGRIVSYRAQWEMDGRRGKPVPCGPSKAYCLEVCAQLRARLWSGALKPGDDPFPRQTGRTFADLVREYRKTTADKASATWTQFEEPAARSFGAFVGCKLEDDGTLSGGRNVADIAPKDVLDWQHSLRTVEWGQKLKRNGLSPTTIAMRGSALRAIFYFAKDVLRWIPDNPVAAVSWPRPGPQGQLIPDDLLAELQPHAAAILRGRRSLWDVLLVALHIGARSGAICGIDGRQVDKSARTIRFARPARVGAAGRSDLKTEGKKERVVAIPAPIWHIFADAPAAGKVFEGWNTNDVAKKLREACRAMNEARKARGLPPYTPIRIHWAKHTFITRYLEAGGTLKSCAAITGNTLASLMVYAHIEDRVAHADVERVRYSFTAPPPYTPKAEAASPLRPGPAAFSRRKK